MEQILEKINLAGISLLRASTPEETYKAVVQEAIDLVSAEYSSILLADNGELKRVYASDPFFNKLKLKKKGTIEQAFKKNKLIVNNITSSTKVDSVIRKKGIQSVILIPLVQGNEVCGVLTVMSLKKEHFSSSQVAALRVFGSMASFAIRKSQHYIEMRKALEIRDMFISMAAHELRTPLTSISGYIQLLYSKFANSDNPSKKWIVALHEENKRMMHLVKELLEVNRLKAGQMQFRWQECDLVTLIKKSIKSVQSKFTTRIINFNNNLKDSSFIIGDSERLQQAFINVLDNALKYSNAKYPVEITLLCKNNSFFIQIKDHGKGIDKQDLPNIFAGHHKGESGEEGFGLGLFFVENIIRQHKGSIGIKSELNKGTFVEFKLPKARFTNFE